MKLVVLLVLGLVAGLSALAGNEIGNGGDSYSLEFAAIGRKMVDKIRANPDPAIGDVEAFARAVNEAQVVTRDKVELGDREVDAANFPSLKRIELNRARWREYSAEEKSALVIHEYLGIAGVDDSSYQVSGSYAQVADPWPRASDRRWGASLGAGVVQPTGNLGKLYSGFSPSIEGRITFLINQYFAAVGGVEHWGHTYEAAPAGFVNVNLTKVSAGLEYHPLTSKQWQGGTGVDPYLSGNVGQFFRSQSFVLRNQVEKDGALGLDLGAGLSFFFWRSRVAIYTEVRAREIFFKDRNDESFLASGIENTKGTIFTGSFGVQAFF